MNLDARDPGLEYIGGWRCGDDGAVRYAEHVGHTTWRVAIARGGALTSQYGGVEIPREVFAWLIRPIVKDESVRAWETGYECGIDAGKGDGPECVNPHR